jgi:hypothetical protein
MSMKRSKQRGSGGREKELDANFWNKPQQPEMTWEQAVEGKADDAFLPYSMAQAYTKGQLVSHAKFGKGVVVDVEPARVEILFQEGKKKLGHNQS